MDVVNFASCAIGKRLDTFGLLLDLVIWFVNWLSLLFSNMGSSLHDLPVATSSHVVWSTKELLHRGLLSANTVLEQTCEGFSILLSLVFYFVNILLIGTQNCFSAIVGPLHKGLELDLTSHLSIQLPGGHLCTVLDTQPASPGVSELHWSCLYHSIHAQHLWLAPNIGHHCFDLALSQPGAASCGPARSSIPGMLSLQRTIYRLYLLAMEQAQALQDNAAVPWGRWHKPRSRTVQPLVAEGWSGVSFYPQSRLEENKWSYTQHFNSRWDDINLDPNQYHHPSTRTIAPPVDTGLLSLLKEHEEWKKCVICQDRVKNVLPPVPVSPLLGHLAAAAPLAAQQSPLPTDHHIDVFL
ncbi:unnamed protein product [Coregonus sp. 'balchen']|nr:unnamed protein product [Coregonus sp. 'balchen']